MTETQLERLTKKDFNHMIKNIRLASSPDAESLILLGSVEGHCSQGHCQFKTRTGLPLPFPNTSREDVVRALHLNPKKIKLAYQRRIDEFKDFLERIVSGEELKTYTNRRGNPLFGVDFFKHIQIKDRAALLTGVYLGSRMDNYLTWRKRTEEKYGLVIGGGECIGIDKKRAKKLGQTLETLANNAHSVEEIETMKELKVLCQNVKSSKNIVSGYVRYKRGKGTSDDLGTLLAGRNYGEDAFWGLFCTDATDTWDKYTPFICANGQDEQLGDMLKDNENRIRQSLPGFKLPSDDEVLKFIYTIAKQSYQKLRVKMISESHRYFIQKDKNTGLTAIEGHLEFLRGNLPPLMRLGWNQKITNHAMYNAFNQKYDEVYGS